MPGHQNHCRRKGSHQLRKPYFTGSLPAFISAIACIVKMFLLFRSFLRTVSGVTDQTFPSGSVSSENKSTLLFSTLFLFAKLSFCLKHGLLGHYWQERSKKEKKFCPKYGTKRTQHGFWGFLWTYTRRVLQENSAVPKRYRITLHRSQIMFKTRIVSINYQIQELCTNELKKI